MSASTSTEAASAVDVKSSVIGVGSAAQLVDVNVEAPDVGSQIMLPRASGPASITLSERSCSPKPPLVNETVPVPDSLHCTSAVCSPADSVLDTPCIDTSW